MSHHVTMSEYRHTQRGGLHYLLYATTGLVIATPWMVGFQWSVAIPLWIIAMGIWALAGSMQYMVVHGERDHLLIRYGPVTLFQKRIPYSEMKDVEPGRTSLIDGWGIHWVPMRGWTYNIWGRTCVKIRLDHGTIRVGTNDPEGLTEYLWAKIGRKA